MPEYLTIKNNLTTEIEIKKSRFITNLIKIESEEDAQIQLADIKKVHRKANHNCSAYILGQDRNIKRMSDDGEPSGTAGIPILSVLEEHELTNVLAVVTRYFGGIKLGKGGLIRAYSNSVSQLLTNEVLAQAVILQEVQLIIPYNLLDQVQYNLKQQNMKLDSLNYSEQIIGSLWLPQETIEEFESNFIDLFNDAISIKKLTTKLKEIPLKKD